ncbi:putative LPS assembly protein LptD [Hymenobacter profundi]|uniref:LPS-assembly protein LptD central domain-containing protein n=1 Tax=Hymenobacter profundi TaxID=1982110 RepID=A0ABS6WXH6_9BACT|nr:putative LPS assembly protein LptD [Hymenobacter profundi]MBW3128296.1 hypothetical protein [Hymenobacter profundi]
MSSLFFLRFIRQLLPSTILLLLLWVGVAGHVIAQTNKRPQTTAVPANADVRPGPIIRPNANDTARVVTLQPVPDSVRVADSLRLAARPKGPIQTTVKYAAKDSIEFDIDAKIAKLYDKATVDYGDMSLKAAIITVDYNKNLMSAVGVPDSTGRTQGQPLFKQGATTYQAGKIDYNFKTRKGKIGEVVTQQGEGFVHAEVVKKNNLDEIYGRNGRYTTCNLADPHFYINTAKMKVIPGQKVITGPFNLVIGGIPTPLGLPFGYFPTPRKGRASGLIIPTFGQSADRGFFLRNGGYYWVPNQNIGVRFTGDVYSGNAETFGGFRGQAEAQYTKRYAYSGLFSFSYDQRPAQRILNPGGIQLESTAGRVYTPRTFWLSWSHTPVARPGGGRFSASVQAGSNNYNRQNNFNARNYLTPAFSSNISYSKQLRYLPINYSIQASQSQNTTTGTMDFTLPDVTVGVARQYLYSLFGLEPKGKIYEQFAVAYTLTARNRISNSIPSRVLEGGAIPLIGGTNTSQILPVKLSNINTLLRNAQTGIQHQFQISLGSYTADQVFGGLLDRVAFLKYLTVQPSINYGETWYFKRLDYSYVEEARAVRIDTVTGFNRVYNYSGGVNMGTNLYGIYQIKGKKIEAIRHKITPSLNYQYSPNFAANDAYFTLLNTGTLVNSQGLLYNQFARDDNGQPIRDRSGNLTPLTPGTLVNQLALSRYNGFAYGVPSGSRTSALTFSLQNSVEMKVRDNQDTTGTTPFKKVSLIDGFDFSTGYNFAVDSLNFAPITATFRTQVARKLNILINGNFVVYQRDSTGTLINRYLFDQPKRRLARLTTAAVQLSYQFNPTSGNKKSTVPRAVAPTNDPMLGTPIPVNPYEDYVDFTLPWELSTSFTASYIDPGTRATNLFYTRPAPLTAVALSLSGSVKLTDNLRLGYNTGYDFKNNTVTFTSLDFSRDLHCWQITGNWRPFGYTQGYYVTIAAKSALLQSLKLNRNKTFLNN